MTQPDSTEAAHRPAWWRTAKVWWFVAIVAVLVLIIVVVMEKVGKPAPLPYSTFLDQLAAGNVASVTFQGTEINGRFKRPLDSTQPETFSSRVPDFGDPTLYRSCANSTSPSTSARHCSGRRCSRACPCRCCSSSVGG